MPLRDSIMIVAVLGFGCAKQQVPLQHLYENHFVAVGLDVGDSGDDDAVVATRALIETITDGCPSFEEALMSLDCTGTPCHVHLWASGGNTWDEMTCGHGDRVPATSVGDLSVFADEDSMLTWRVYALSEPNDVDLEHERERAFSTGPTSVTARVATALEAH